MARKKNSVSPFEVVAGIGRTQHKPAGGERPKPADQQGETAQTPTQPVQPQSLTPTVKVPQQPQLQKAGAESPGQAQPGEPMLSTEGGRLNLSLNYLSSVVLLGGLLVLLLGAFVLGRSTAPQPQAPTEVNKAGTEPVITEKRVPGWYYLVVEAMNGNSTADIAQAEALKTYLDKHGVPVTMHGYDQNGVRAILISRAGFENPQSPAAGEFVERVHQLGQQYADQFGSRFNFRPAKPGEDTGPWFVQWEQQ